MKWISFTTLGAIACALSWPFTSAAAPIPATSTSKLIEPHLGLFRSPLGFELNAGDSGWVHAEAPSDSKFVQTVYRAPKPRPGAKAPASLTVRIDSLEKPLPIQSYIKRWHKEYPKYGFDVLGAKPFVQKGMQGYVLDLLNRDSQKQIRQVVFMRNTNAVIMTCRDDAKAFKGTLKSCNQIIRSFAWKN